MSRPSTTRWTTSSTPTSKPGRPGGTRIGRSCWTPIPALADDLERFFAAHDEMDRLARPLRDVAVAARVVVAADLGDGPDRRLPIPVEFGAYVFLEVLGAGGMGIVYRAHHRVLNRDVALKQILAGPLAERGRRAAVPQRGRGRGAAPPPEHRADPRRRRAPGPALPDHDA